MARELLVKGLTNHPKDPAYARIVLYYLIDCQADAKVIELADQIRQSPLMAGSLGKLAGMAAAIACFHRGYYDRAEGYLVATGLAHDRDGRLLQAKIQWERGYAELALHLMRDLAVDFPDDEEVYALGSSYLRQSGRLDEARRVSLMFQLRRPESALPRIDLLHAHAREGKVAALRQTTEEILRRFAQNEKFCWPWVILRRPPATPHSPAKSAPACPPPVKPDNAPPS